METINFIALTEKGQHRIAIPLEMVGNINAQMSKHPDGLPITLGSGEQIIAHGLLIPAKSMAKKLPLLVFAEVESNGE